MFDKLAKLFFSKHSYNLWKALDHEDDWSVGEYHMDHKPSGIMMWTANGSLFFNGYSYGNANPYFTGYLERHILYWKACKFGRNQIKTARQLEKERTNKLLEGLNARSGQNS